MSRALLRFAATAFCAAGVGFAPAARGDGEGPVAIVHATVYRPGGQPPLADGTVVLAAGKVQAVGSGTAIPAGARVIDGRGKVVTAGFIDADTDVGVVDVELEPQANDAEARGMVAPAVRLADAYNPRSVRVPIARAGGVTSVVVVPRQGLLAGQSVFADLAGDSVAEAVVRASVAQHAHLDADTGLAAAGTRGAMWLALREALDDARFYSTHRAQYDANAVRPLSLHHAELEALVPVVRGLQPLVVDVHRASDIEEALHLVDDYGLRLVLEGASEAWLFAGEIARRKVPVVLDPLEDLPEGFDRLHVRADQAAVLSRAGVLVVIATFSSFGSRQLRQHAANAVRLGMDHAAAIRAVTEAPADAFGLSGYGRLEAGAVGNVVVWSGDPLQAGTQVEHVFVRAREQSLETRQTLLLRRYRTLPVRREGYEPQSGAVKVPVR